MNDERRQTILQHLEEFRWRVVKSSLALVVTSIVAFVFRDWILDILVQPYRDIGGDNELIALKPTEAFGSAMRLAFFGGLLLASPVLLYQLWAFINPALSKRERKWTIPIVAALVVLFAGGVVFAYSVLPRGLEFFASVLDVEFRLQITEYLKFVTLFLLVFGLSFEFPVFLFATAAAGLVSSKKLADNRRWAVTIIVVVAAVVTPTGDPYTLLLLSGPLYLLYEITIWLIRWTLRK
ncbi:MAG TPA: twin-arginine translocase subunit TatC [Acidimicrobiia bacterium]|nr:twin-arginine translocase subunit TatC [Acidimicrobiia bacterium]